MPRRGSPGVPAAIGLDIHKRETQACVVSERGEVLEEKRFKTQREAFEHELAEYAGVPVVIEAVGFSRPVARWLQEQGHDVRLAHPRAIPKPMVKTDKKDARHLAQLLRVDLLPEAWLAPEDVQQLRDLARHRRYLGEQRASVRGKIKHDLLKHGHLLDKNPVETKKGRDWLRSLEIPEITSSLNLYELLVKECDDMETKISHHADKDHRARILRSIPGVGDFTALLVLAEVGDFTRFPDKDKLASYAGFGVRQEQSGDTDRRGRITKEGNDLLRWAMVEAARNHTIHCPESSISQRYERLKKTKGQGRALIATARVLLTCMYILVKENREFTVNQPDS